MKTLALIIAASMAAGTTALAQSTTVQGNASAESRTAVAADRRGANIAADNRAQGGVVGEQGVGRDGAAGQSGAGLAGASEMNATLERPVDARRAKPGDEVTAKMNGDFMTASGATIPRGSRLVGRVTEARPHARDARGEGSAASQLGIVFDKAVLKDGREVPIHATIQALAAAQSHARGGSDSLPHDFAAGAFGSSHAAGSGGLGAGAIGGLGGASGSVLGGVAGSAGGTVGSATRLPRPAIGAAANGAGSAAASGGGLVGSSAGAVGGLNGSGEWLAGSRGTFGMGDMSIASAATGSAQGSLITSTSRNVRLEGGTQLLLVGSASAAR